MSNPRKSPCQECPYRKLTCHDHCSEYTEWHDALVLAKESVSMANRAIDLLADGYYQRRDAWKKKLKRR